jgi:hypothetical protein
MATLTKIVGYLYDASGQVVTVGKLSLKLQQDMVSVDGTKVAPFTVIVDLSVTAGLVDVDVYACQGASPSGLSYRVEFDPAPATTSIPARSKDGYWENYWAVPNLASVPLGNFTSARRGEPLSNYIPISGVVGTTGPAVSLGTTPAATNKRLIANQTAGANPELRFNATTAKWQFSNDGVTFTDIGAGGTFGGGDISAANGAFSGTVSAAGFSGPGAGLTGLKASNLGSGTIPTGRFPATLPALSGANLTSLNASALASGTVPLTALADITNNQIATAAAIAWSKISKTGSSLGDLVTRNAADLNAGSVPIARGGTGGSATPTNGGVAYGTGSTYAFTPAGTAGQILKVGATLAPEWGDPSAASGHALLGSAHTDVTAAAVARGALIAGIGATPSWQRLLIGAAGTFLRSSGTEPAWSADGSALTGLNASSISSGELADARLSANVLRGNSANIFAALQTFNLGIKLANDQAVLARNAANSADLQVLKVGANNETVVGHTSGRSALASDKGELWLDVSGTSPNQVISVKARVAGVDYTITSITR